jgi:hypothetical protein
MKAGVQPNNAESRLDELDIYLQFSGLANTKARLRRNICVAVTSDFLHATGRVGYISLNCLRGPSVVSGA